MTEAAATPAVTSSKFRYHPDPTKPTAVFRRNVDGRLAAIVKYTEPQGKRVVDLGCSNGYFCYRLATSAARVIGLDRDGELVAGNRQVALQLGLSNVEFVEGSLTPELVRSEELPPADVTLFLSVMQHIVARAHRANPSPGGEAAVAGAVELLRAIREKTKVLCFEMGEPGEAFGWARSLPPSMRKNPPEWIASRLLVPAGFTVAHSIVAPQWTGPRRMIYGTLKALEARGLRPPGMSRLIKYDVRDGRTLFIAR